MKKIITFILLLIILCGCSVDFNDEKNNKIVSIEKEVIELKKEKKQQENSFSLKITELEQKNKDSLEKIKQLSSKPNTSIVDIKFTNITFDKVGLNSVLKCNGKYDSALSIYEENGKSKGTITENSENFDLEILSFDKIKMFGTDFNIILNNDNYIIAMRLYEESGLTEILHLNKNNGILIDSKTYTKWMGNAPSSFDVIFSCK